MNSGSTGRRVFYIAAMVAILVPLFMLGQPAVRGKGGTEGQEGGILAKLRSKYDLGQGDLGDIDPASESARLATLGMRGVASTILWQRAEYYKREQYWDRFSATLNQIALLQPHFVKVWEFQSWNLSYNISVEFDDYRQRYDWVKKGIDYLIQGTTYNRRRPHLPYELGWFFGSKMGVADEKLQFRDLYRHDKQFHDDLSQKGMDVNVQEGLGPDNLPDNWLSGRLWYEKAYEIVRAGALPSKGPINFYRMAPQWLINYAQAIETEGVLNEAAAQAWRRAGVGWREFGEIQMETTFGDVIRLTELNLANQRLTEAQTEFLAFCKAKNDELSSKRRDLLNPKQLEAMAIPEEKRTAEEMALVIEANSTLQAPFDEVAKAMPSDMQLNALQLAMNVRNAEEFRRHVEIYRNQINYGYWEVRCDAEQTDEALAARSNMYEANKALDLGDLDEALKKYDTAWVNWDKLFGRYPTMMLDESADEVMAAMKRYQRLLDTPEMPDTFALKNFVEFRRRYDSEGQSPYLMEVLNKWSQNVDRGSFFDKKPPASSASPTNNDATNNTVEEKSPAPAPNSPASATPSVSTPDAGQPPAPSSKEASQVNPTVKQPGEQDSATNKPQANNGNAGSSPKVSNPDEGSPPSPKTK